MREPIPNVFTVAFQDNLLICISTVPSQTKLGALMPGALSDLSTFECLNYTDDFLHINISLISSLLDSEDPFYVPV